MASKVFFNHNCGKCGTYSYAAPFLQIHQNKTDLEKKTIVVSWTKIECVGLQQNALCLIKPRVCHSEHTRKHEVPDRIRLS